jgi:hypothetical protein
MTETELNQASESESQTKWYPEGKGLPTPWGPAQHLTEYAKGCVSVGTAGHGGMMIGKAFARKHLSEAAIKRGIVFGQWLGYEEDCEWEIPAFELPEFWPTIFKHHPGRDNRAYLLRDLSYWNADYLLERGIEPDLEGYASFLKRKTNDEMRRTGHPDLIVSAKGEWHTKNPDVTEVTTADGKAHLVTAASYTRIFECGRDRTDSALLLSECEKAP